MCVCVCLCVCGTWSRCRYKIRPHLDNISLHPFWRWLRFARENNTTAKCADVQNFSVRLQSSATQHFRKQISFHFVRVLAVCPRRIFLNWKTRNSPCCVCLCVCVRVMAVVGQRVAAAAFDSSDLYSSEWERYLCKRGIFGLFREKNPPLGASLRRAAKFKMIQSMKLDFATFWNFILFNFLKIFLRHFWNFILFYFFWNFIFLKNISWPLLN